MQLITTEAAPAALGPYSQALRVGEMVYFSGQIPLVMGDFREQALQVFQQLQVMARAAGGDLDRMVKLTVYLTDLLNFPMLNEVMLSLFKEPYPVRTTVQVSALPRAAWIEVDAVMVI